MDKTRLSALRDPLLYGTLIDSLSPSEIDDLFLALNLDSTQVSESVSRLENALEFIDYQSRVPNWFAEAQVSLGESGELTFTSKYSGRKVEIRPYWTLGRTDLVQSFSGRRVDWNLWVGDQEIVFRDGKAEASLAFLLAILAEAGMPSELAQTYARRLAKNGAELLVGEADGFMGPQWRRALGTWRERLIEAGYYALERMDALLDDLAAFLMPPRESMAVALTRFGAPQKDERSHEPQMPVLIFDITETDRGTLLLTLGWPDKRFETADRVMVKVNVEAPEAVQPVIWTGAHLLEIPSRGLSPNNDVSASWDAQEKTLLLRLHAKDQQLTTDSS